MVGDADPPPAPASAGTFRDRLRNCFSAALHGLAADGVVAIDAAEIPVLLEQVRETADAKFGGVNGGFGFVKSKGREKACYRVFNPNGAGFNRFTVSVPRDADNPVRSSVGQGR